MMGHRKGVWGKLRKGRTRDLWGEGIVRDLGWGARRGEQHRSTLVCAQNCGYARRHHWGSLNQGYPGPLCTVFTTSCESTLFQNKMFLKIIYRVFSGDRVNDITKFNFSLLICLYIQSMNIKMSNDLVFIKNFSSVLCIFINLANL